MQDRHLYEYAVIRVVPRVDREEFINIGVIIFCKKERFIKMLYTVNKNKLELFSQDLDLEQLEQNLEAFKNITEGKRDAGPIAQLDVPSRFRWLTAVRSSVIQTSRPHPGLCVNLDKTIERLFLDLVL